ncbi:coilin isoform X2 [Leptopilina boulardi]|uniref:coilin isoform X2 n=1 Tax=Leptopilina boulardi TaxID=63433 RepID=UPI0021F665C9|nr:coilin isoform X2 [Leptopilina boulardi]
MDKTNVNFRVKVDLSKFFQDHRKISWVFVDRTKTSCIKHLKDHIAKIFGIQNFHILSDSANLPCDENVSIIQYDNLITLVPGSSVNNNNNNNNNSVSTFDEKEVQTDKDDSNEDENTTVLSGYTLPETTNVTMYHSLLDESEAGSSTAESKEMDSIMTEDLSYDTNTPAKRKRSRRKRIKRLDTSSNSKIDNSPQEEKRKPKIIDQVVLSTGKHIRFSNHDEEIISPNSCKSPNISEFQSKFIESPISKSSSSNSLDALLSLKQCSTPLTFSCTKNNNKQIKSSKIITPIHEDIENLTESDRNMISQKEKSFDINSYDSKEVEKIPILTTNPQEKDTVAFKMVNKK